MASEIDNFNWHISIDPDDSLTTDLAWDDKIITVVSREPFLSAIPAFKAIDIGINLSY